MSPRPKAEPGELVMSFETYFLNKIKKYIETFRKAKPRNAEPRLCIRLMCSNNKEKTIPMIAKDNVSLSGSKLVCMSILAKTIKRLNHEQIIIPLKSSLGYKVSLRGK